MNDVPSLVADETNPGGSSLQPEPADEVQFRHILFSPNDDPMAARDLPSADPAWRAAEAEAMAEYELVLENPAAFLTDARTMSDDTELAAYEGLTRYLRRDDLDPAIAAAIFRTELEPGEILPPVRSSFGWHVIQFVGRRVSQEAIQRAAAAAAAAHTPGDRLLASVDDGLHPCPEGECHELTVIYRSGAVWSGTLGPEHQGVQPSFKLDSSLASRLSSLIDSTDFESILRRPVLAEGTACPGYVDGPVWDYEFDPASGPSVSLVACRYGVDIATEEPFKTFWQALESQPR